MYCARSMPHVPHRAQVRNRRPDHPAAARARRRAACWQGAVRTHARAHARMRALPCKPTQRVMTGAACSAITSANRKRASEPHAPELSLIDPLSVAAIYLLQPCSRAHPPTPATARCKRQTGQDATGDAARRERRVGTRRVAGTGARSAQRLAAERRAAFRLVWRGVAVQSGRPRMVHCDPHCHSVGWCKLVAGRGRPE